MKKTVFYLPEGIDEIDPLLRQLDTRIYSVVTTKAPDLEATVSSRVEDEASPFVFVLSKKAFQKEETGRRIAGVLAQIGIRADPTFLVVGSEFSLEEMERVLQRGNLFFAEGSDAPHMAGFLRFKAALDKVFLDYEYNRRLIEYITEDLESFVEQERLRSSKEVVEQLNEELEQKNRIDELTQLLNRKGIIESLQIARGRASRERWRLNGRPAEDGAAEELEEVDIQDYFGRLSCMMIDIDDFKRINDTYGHLMGDEVLRRIGQIFNKDGIFRKEDICGRYGGEEFIVILPATSGDHARIPSEKLRRAVEALRFTTESGEEFGTTVSIGIAELSDGDELIERLIARADAALYRAKQTGKNKSVIFRSEDFSDEEMVAAAGRHNRDDVEELEQGEQGGQTEQDERG